MVFHKPLILASAVLVLSACDHQNFNRVASFPVCSQLDADCNVETETSAEIAAVSSDGKIVVYTDSPMESLGFTDITDPAKPLPLGTLALPGEPTSVAVTGPYALVAVNTSADYVDVGGALLVVDVATHAVITSLDLGGQPDSIAISPDGRYAAVAIENERDEDLGDGAPPQMPAGYLVIVDLVGAPASWTTRIVDMSGLADLYAADPEPEYVDINGDNIAVVTMQENNHIVLVNLVDGSIVNHFSAGTVDLDKIDTEEEDPALISLTSRQDSVLREPDGVSWIDNQYFATANEGDLDGGSRGFSIFDIDGHLMYDSGNELDHIAVRLGHYPDSRSGNKGNEPENVEVAMFGDHRYMFVNSERASLVFVYDITLPTQPVYKQTLPAGVGPEGVVAIPSRQLVVTASEEDSRDDKIRAALNIYQFSAERAMYPTLQSVDRADGTPIPWGAMSGLAADPRDKSILYAVDDSFYQQNRIFTIALPKYEQGKKPAEGPAEIVDEIRIVDSNNVFASMPVVALADASVDDGDPSRVNVFDEADLAAMINDDKSVNIDPEGIAVASDGGFWIASEGNGTAGDSGRPINSLNVLFKTDAYGVIEQVITLPAALNEHQLRFGFEGVTEYNGSVYVAFQRVWPGDDNVRIGVYDTVAQQWSFLFYPLDAVESQNGGWVGLSDISSLGHGEFMVVERDNQGGPDAAIKRLYRFDTNGLADGSVVSKTLVRDLMDDLQQPGGLVPEKIEGLAVTRNGDVWIVNDNDGVDDNSGETELLNLGKALKKNK